MIRYRIHLCQNIQPFSKVWLEGCWYIPHHVSTHGEYVRVIYWTGFRYFTYFYKKGELVCSQRKSSAWFFGWH